MYTLEGEKNPIVFFPGQKTGCTHGDHDEEEEERETGPMIRDMDKQGMSQTYSS